MTLWDFSGLRKKWSVFRGHHRSPTGRTCFIFYWKLENNLCYGGTYQNQSDRQHIRKADIIWQLNIWCQQQACLRDHAFTQHKHPGAHSAQDHTRIWEYWVSQIWSCLPGACAPLGPFKKWTLMVEWGWIIWEWAKEYFHVRHLQLKVTAVWLCLLRGSGVWSWCFSGVFMG